MTLIPFSQFKTTGPSPVVPPSTSKILPFSQFKAAPPPPPGPAKTKTGNFFSNLMQGAGTVMEDAATGSLSTDQLVGAAKKVGNQVVGLGATTASIMAKAPINKGAVGNFFKGGADAGVKLQDSPALQPSNVEQNVGGQIVNVAEGAVGGGEAKAEAVATDAGKFVAEKGKILASKGGELAKTLAIGKEGMDTLEKLSNVETQKFINGKTFGETEKLVSGAVDQFTKESKAALKTVKDTLPNDAMIKGGASEIATRVNQAITSTFEKGAQFKGVLERTFKSPQDLINKGLLNPDEAKTVKGMIKTVSEYADNSVRGTLNLKEQLDSFYKNGADNSNAVLRNIQSSLKDLVTESAPTSKIKTALKIATDNISKAEEFEKNLTGKSAQQGESKILQIARNLKDPARNSETLKLVQDLEKATGKKILPELKGIYDYLKLTKGGAEEAPTKAGTILKRVAIAGGIGAAGLEVKNLLFGGN